MDICRIKKLRAWLCFMVVLVGASCVGSSAAFAQDNQPSQLRWKFAQGDKFEVDIVQHLNQSTDVNGKKFDYVTNFDLGMDWSVVEVTEDGAKINQSFRHLKIEWTPVGGEDPVVFDSREESKRRGAVKHVAKTLLPLLDCKFDVVMTARGEIVAVDVSDETKKILRSLPDSMEIRKLFTKEGISSTLSQTAIVFPEKKIADGESWESTDDIDSPAGKVTLNRTYKLIGNEKVDGRPLAKITINGEIDFVQTVSSKARKPQTIIANSQSGELLFDAESGTLVSSELKQEIETVSPYRDTDLTAATESTVSVHVKRVE